MEADAAEKYKEKLTALEAQINEVQGKLDRAPGQEDRGRQAPRLARGDQRAIEDFQKQAAELRGERRGIRLALREGIDSPGEPASWPSTCWRRRSSSCVFGFWFYYAKRRR